MPVIKCYGKQLRSLLLCLCDVFPAGAVIKFLVSSVGLTTRSGFFFFTNGTMFIHFVTRPKKTHDINSQFALKRTLQSSRWLLIYFYAEHSQDEP